MFILLISGGRDDDKEEVTSDHWLYDSVTLCFRIHELS